MKGIRAKTQASLLELTQYVVGALQAGRIPWTRSYDGWPGPQNAVTGERYEGANRWILNSVMVDPPLWATYRQWREIGGQVQLGERGIRLYEENVVSWFAVSVDHESGEEIDVPRWRRTLEPTAPVFHISQTDLPIEAIPTAALEWRRLLVGQSREHALDVVWRLFQGFQPSPRVQHEGPRAWYDPANDVVNLPAKRSRGNAARYALTAVHEYAHASGHPSRLNRFDRSAPGSFFQSGCQTPEELTALMTTNIIAAEMGLPLEPTEVDVEPWRRLLLKRPDVFRRCACHAEECVDFMYEGARLPEAVEQA